MTAPPPPGVGSRAMGLITDLYPICRSITGDGVRATLRRLLEEVPLDIHEVPTGTKVLDWLVPREWNIRDAFIADSTGRRLVDFREHNLHVVGYSVPVSARMSLDELRPHLHTLPDLPDAIPYRTSYYTESWGFCLRHDQLDALPDGEYEVVIDSELTNGALTYGEVLVPGGGAGEIVVSSHVCHPSLADDNLSGIAVATLLAQHLLDGPPPRHDIRFVFAPGTIGTITWLARNRERTPRIVGGLTLTCLGDDQPFTYKRTVGGATPVDQAATTVLRDRQVQHGVIDFFPYGYDERQYNSPGFRIPVGSLMRGRHGQFREYHTSLDDLSFVSAEQLEESYRTVAAIIDALDRNRTMRNLEPFGEPQLGSRGLYGALGGTTIPDAQLAMLWVLNLSDGEHSLLDIADRSGIAFASIADTAAVLETHGLLAELAAP